MSRRIPPELMDMIRQRIERTSGERPPPELMDAIRQRMESNVARRSSFAAPRICYHTAHSCGHSVYWSAPEWAVATFRSPCPWCGGDTGVVQAPTPGAIHDARNAVHIWSDIRKYSCPGCQAPGSQMRIQHMTDGACCKYPPPGET